MGRRWRRRVWPAGSARLVVAAAVLVVAGAAGTPAVGQPSAPVPGAAGTPAVGQPSAAVPGATVAPAQGQSAAPVSGDAAAVAQDPYDAFNAFAATHFGALYEAEVARHCGSELSIVADGSWRHVSERSAVIAWQTSLPVWGRIVFGPVGHMDRTTEAEERPFYLHVHYLRHLAPGTEYHYRLVGEDERGGAATSGNLTLTTAPVNDALRIPADVSGPPFLLDTDGAHYILSEDVTAPATAFNISGRDVTLDLGGHTVIYDSVAGSPDPMPPGTFGAARPRGIRSRDGSVVTVVNGIVRQGAGSGTADPYGYQPIHLYNPGQSVVAGMTLEWHGRQVTGLEMFGGGPGGRVHHNVLVDRGTGITDRHQGLDAIVGASGTQDASAVVDHNLVKRTRHRGIRAGRYASAEANEIYVDSWATNSYGVMYYSQSADRPIHDVVIRDNRIFGTGYHPIGIGSGYCAHDIDVIGNYIQMQAETPAAYRWPPGPGDPPGQLQTANGIRYHKGPQRDVSIEGNTIVVKGRGTAEEPVWMRGVWATPLEGAYGVAFRLNRVKVLAENEHADGHAVAALGGSEDRPTQLRFHQNVLMANTSNVRFGDSYGHGGIHYFFDTTLMRLGDDPRYATIKLGWQGWSFDTYGHQFLDSVFEGGAGYQLVSFEGAAAARQEFGVAWRLFLTTEPMASVVIRNALDEAVYVELLPEGEAAGIPLVQFVRSRSGNVFHTPHRVYVTNPGEDVVLHEVTMDRPRYLTVKAQPSQSHAVWLPYAAQPRAAP